MRHKNSTPRIRTQKRIAILTIALFILGIFLFFACNNRLTVRSYEIKTDKIHDAVRIAFLADLHSCRYGEGQSELLDCIEAQQPDLIVLGGDIVDDKLPVENATLVLESLSKKYPCFYISGNHEYWSGRIAEIKQMVSGYGISVLEGQNKVISVDGQSLNLCGIDDAEIGTPEFMQQLEQAGSQTDPTLYTILLAHRPEYIDTYLQYDFDLILSGHAHGGQWRIPGLVNGFLAPNQGFFPKYAGGKYQFNQKTFIVSRGLAKESTRIPRIFNPPELVVIDLVSADR